MAKKTINCEEIKKGTYVYWNICTQAWNDFTVTIKDSKTGHVYFTGHKGETQSGSIVNISRGSELVQLESDSPILCIESSKSSELKTSISAYNAVDNSGKTVGVGYNVCVEDSNDDDYNDLYINIIAWNKVG